MRQLSDYYKKFNNTYTANIDRTTRFLFGFIFCIAVISLVFVLYLNRIDYYFSVHKTNITECAEQNNADVCYQLGIDYRDGIHAFAYSSQSTRYNYGRSEKITVLSKNIDKALFYWDKSCALGNQDACFYYQNWSPDYDKKVIPLAQEFCTKGSDEACQYLQR